MADTAFRLQDRTVLLVGPFNGTTQAFLRTLTEFGSDVAYVCDQAPQAARYVDGLNDLREVHGDYGRAVHFPLSLDTPADIAEALGRLTESFGRADILLDASPMVWSVASEGDHGASEASLEIALDKRRQLAEQVLPFLMAKQKGRILYVFEDECLEKLGQPVAPNAWRKGLTEYISDLARRQIGKNITVNGLALGVTEDFLLRHFAKLGSIRKALEELKRSHSHIKLVESTEVGLGAAYLTSAISGSVSGQVLRLTHGFHLTR